MDWLFGGLIDWFKQCLIDAIMSSFSGIFDKVNQQVGDIAVQVGQSPQGWNSDVFNMVRMLSETIIIPIAGMILTFVMCYEIIQMIIDKNNMHDFDTFSIFKWMFKTFVAVFILTNTFNIVMGIFDMAQSVVTSSAGLITGDLNIGDETMMATILAQLEAMEIGELLGLFIETAIVKICMSVLGIVIFIIVWGRMLEIYITISIAPIPLSTMANREWGQMGTNYLRSLFAIGFQGFLIMICVAIYAVLVAAIGDAENLHGAIWAVAGYTALLCVILLKTASISKSIFNVH